MSSPRVARRALALARPLVALGVAALGASCMDGGAPRPTGPKVAFEVAPLSLPGVDEASWSITVEAGGQVVWSQTGLTSSQYGDGRGAISYVGTCDATYPTNTVTLVLERLESGGQDLVGTFQNPTPVARDFDCVENQDTSVVFNLTLLRDAKQGFFDVAVTFDDIFCSAKLDCETADGGPLELLFDGHGARAQTVVLAFACTAGPGEHTNLYLSDLAIQCAGEPLPYLIDPARGPGNITLAGAPDMLFGAATYRGREQLPGLEKCYWNTAVGLDVTALGAGCTLTATATAAAEPLVGSATPTWTSWPVVTWSGTLTDEAGALACHRHPLNGGDGVVATAYTPLGPAGVGFPHHCDCLTGVCGDVALCGNGQLDAGEACDGGEGCGPGCVCAPGTVADPGTLGCAASLCGPGVSCDDNDACTVDSCDPATGCAHTDLSCDDQDKCTEDTCDRTAGCGYALVVCDDQDACTLDECDPDTGCGFVRIACDDNDPCTDDSCDPELGCVYTANPALCPTATCGNGVVESGEVCDSGMNCFDCACPGTYQAVTPNGCERCGDRVPNGGEVCDGGANCDTSCMCAPGSTGDGLGGCAFPKATLTVVVGGDTNLDGAVDAADLAALETGAPGLEAVGVNVISPTGPYFDLRWTDSLGAAAPQELEVGCYQLLLDSVYVNLGTPVVAVDGAGGTVDLSSLCVGGGASTTVYILVAPRTLGDSRFALATVDDYNAAVLFLDRVHAVDCQSDPMFGGYVDCRFLVDGDAFYADVKYGHDMPHFSDVDGCYDGYPAAVGYNFKAVNSGGGNTAAFECHTQAIETMGQLFLTAGEKQALHDWAFYSGIYTPTSNATLLEL